MEEKIESILNNKVRPKLFQHGGDVKFCYYKDGIVTLKMLGQCSSCVSAKITATEIIETALKDEIPEIKRVELSSCLSSEILDFAKKILKRD